MTEREFMTAVLDLARLLKWKCYHTHRSDRSEAGWPDLAMVRPSRLILAELKTATGKVSTAQQAWLDALRQVEGIEVYLWRPSDMPAILRVLR